jgi:serine/threonine protein phosphatase 1
MIYVASDLHGCAVEDFQALLDRAGFRETDELFVLGDVIDRGAHGSELLLWLTQQPNVHFILGNHEAMMLSCAFLFDEVTEITLGRLSVDDLKLMNHWQRNGGDATIAGMRKFLKEDPELVAGILDYLREAPLYETVEVGGRKFVLVHGGLGNFDPDKSLDSYTLHDFLWERPNLDTVYYPDATVILGHTPTVCYGPEYRGKILRTETWINIDAGVSMGCGPALLRLDDLTEFY